MRTNGRNEIPWSTELGTQTRDRGLDDASDDASPAGVHGRHDAAVSIADQHWNAIRDSNAAGKGSDPRYQAVARPVANRLGRIPGAHNADIASMDLVQPDQLGSV